jgi:predicted aspartyl protease
MGVFRTDCEVINISDATRPVIVPQ